MFHLDLCYPVIFSRICFLYMDERHQQDVSNISNYIYYLFVCFGKIFGRTLKDYLWSQSLKVRTEVIGFFFGGGGKIFGSTLKDYSWDQSLKVENRGLRVY